jgi:hypothetical protein
MDAEMRAVRFGYGLPVADIAAPTGADRAAATWPGVDLTELAPILMEYRAAKKAKDEVAIKAGHEGDLRAGGRVG